MQSARVLIGSALLVLALSAVSAQDAALRDRVNQLVERLAAEPAEDREKAERGLIELGPRALPFLPEAARVKGDEARQRLERIRGALEAAEERSRLTAAKVTIQGKGLRLTEALKQLQQQSGNVVTDLREQFGEEASNPQLDLEIADRSFFEALDTICKAAGLAPNFYTGDGSIGLMAGPPGGSSPAPVVYTGPFRVVLKQLVLSRNFEAEAATAGAQFEVAWEPRLRPMLLALKAEDVTIADDRGTAVQPSVPEESSSVVIRPENPVAEINLNMTAPERAARKLARIQVKAELTLPAGVRTFRFSDVSKATEQKAGEVRIGVRPVVVEEQVWKYRVVLQYPGEGPAFESFQQGLFNNRLWLQRPDGGRFEHNGGFNSLGSDSGRIAFEYLFVDVPGKPSDYVFVYEAPSRVESVPIVFEFTDVPLP